MWRVVCWGGAAQIPASIISGALRELGGFSYVISCRRVRARVVHPSSLLIETCKGMEATTKKGYIIDPTIRIETDSSQPEDVNKEKINIYLPTVEYFKAKYQLEDIEPAIGHFQNWLLLVLSPQETKQKMRRPATSNSEDGQ
ncbi:hypothetical protein ANN_05200 [Periplaneta americana]|uniref:Uncharacterized protein n=1 Tax=Periplaneta americana TaxID=6978 RepID=A0ABQ8TBB8_PERAM|nr:hypothetical protein ANN_05200 [Periplaneta americana]